MPGHTLLCKGNVRLHVPDFFTFLCQTWDVQITSRTGIFLGERHDVLLLQCLHDTKHNGSMRDEQRNVPGYWYQESGCKMWSREKFVLPGTECISWCRAVMEGKNWDLQSYCWEQMSTLFAPSVAVMKLMGLSVHWDTRFCSRIGFIGTEVSFAVLAYLSSWREAVLLHGQQEMDVIHHFNCSKQWKCCLHAYLNGCNLLFLCSLSHLDKWFWIMLSCSIACVFTVEQTVSPSKTRQNDLTRPFWLGIL